MRQWVRRAAPAALVGMSASVAGLMAPAPAHAVSPDIVISQVYGGGGNSGATYTHDFIELQNRGAAPVSVAGWSVQYASSSGSTWLVTPISGTIAAGGYYLVRQAQGANPGTALPTPDATGMIAMGAGAGKVALVTSATSLSCGTDCDGAPGVRDFVGYGAANDAEGAPVPNLSNTTAALRDAGADTDDNSADFTVGAPNPRDSAPPPAASAQLAVTKNDVRDPVTAGQDLTYTIQVANSGPDAAQTVEVTDTLPPGTTFVSFTTPAGWTATTPAVGGTGTVRANKATLAVGEPASFTLVVNVGAGTTGVLSNTATISSATGDPNAADNADTEITTLRQPSANLAVRKADVPDPVTAGQNLTYTIHVRNLGPSAARSVQFGDTVPTGTTFVSFSAPGGWSATTPAVGGTGAVTATKATVDPDETAEFTLVVNVNAAATGTIVNTSTISSSTPDPFGPNNTDTATTTIAGSVPGCTITGTQRTDIINGTPGDDVICGLGGNDIINGRGGNDTVYGGTGSDLLSGGTGNDTVYGEAGNDLIKVDDEVAGNDTADGGTGFDLCSADPADVTISCP